MADSLTIPESVRRWVFDAFRSCNERISAKLSRIPNSPEESLDMTWVEHFSQYAVPTRIDNNWTVRFETHYLGGLWHFHRWEIADIGVLLFIKTGGELRRTKVALLQSKRLYPSKTPVSRSHTESTLRSASRA
jgi:hypothetical protein